MATVRRAEGEDGGEPGARLRKAAASSPTQGPVDAPMMRAGRKMKAESEAAKPLKKAK